MLRQKVIPGVLNGYLNLNRTYLSNNFKKVVNERLELPFMEGGADLKSFRTTIKPSAIGLDYLLNKQYDNENRDRQIDLRDLLFQIRSTNQGTKVMESTNHSVMKYFVETGSTNEFLHILSDKINYGIFINNITGCYLMDHLLNKNDFFAAAQTAVVSIVIEELCNELLHALALKSCFEYLNTMAKVSKEANVDATEKLTEKKVRVKYLRNYSYNLMDINKNLMPLVGKTLMMADKCPKEISFNMKVIGHVLCKQYIPMVEQVMAEPNLVDKDIANICLTLINDEREVPAEFLDVLKTQKNNNLKSEPFANKLTLLIIKAVQKEEAILIENQQEKYAKWADDRKISLIVELEDKTQILREAKIKNILTDLNKMKQHLWYFSSEDKIELEIYRNRKTYPKRWFGKKKNAKVIDDFYIPPEI